MRVFLEVSEKKGLLLVVLTMDTSGSAAFAASVSCLSMRTTHYT